MPFFNFPWYSVVFYSFSFLKIFPISPDFISLLIYSGDITIQSFLAYEQKSFLVQSNLNCLFILSASIMVILSSNFLCKLYGHYFTIEFIFIYHFYYFLFLQVAISQIFVDFSSLLMILQINKIILSLNFQLSIFLSCIVVAVNFFQVWSNGK